MSKIETPGLMTTGNRYKQVRQNQGVKADNVKALKITGKHKVVKKKET